MVKLNSGAILQIPLPKGLGFAYAKYIDLQQISPTSDFSDTIKIYGYKTENEKYDLEVLQKQDYLLPLVMVNYCG